MAAADAPTPTSSGPVQGGGGAVPSCIFRSGCQHRSLCAAEQQCMTDQAILWRRVAASTSAVPAHRAAAPGAAGPADAAAGEVDWALTLFGRAWSDWDVACHVGPTSKAIEARQKLDDARTTLKAVIAVLADPGAGGAGEDHPLRCANCGATITTSTACIGMVDGEASCSNECYDEHERLGCPQEHGAAYRSRAKASPDRDEGAALPGVDLRAGLVAMKRATYADGRSAHDYDYLSVAIDKVVAEIDRARLAALPGVEPYPWLLRGVGDDGPGSVSYLDPEGWTDDLSEATGYLLRITADGAAADAKLEGITVEVVHRDVAAADAARLAARGAPPEGSADLDAMARLKAETGQTTSAGMFWAALALAKQAVADAKGDAADNADGEPTFSVALEAALSRRDEALASALEPDTDDPWGSAAVDRAVASFNAESALRRAIRAEIDAAGRTAPAAGEGLRKALASAAGGGGTDGWSFDMDAAPRDERDILVFCADTGQQFVAFRSFHGWQYAEAREGYSIVCRPVAWRPLLAPPVSPGAAL